MPANDARRLELLRDAGFPDPASALARLRDDVGQLPLPGGAAAEADVIRTALAARVARLPAEQARLAQLVPELIGDRSGDLATALWLARAQHGDALDLPGFSLAILDALLATGREMEGLALARFLLDGRFDWQKVYDAGTVPHEFLRPRDPNPLIWQLLDDLAPYRPLRVIELGCGIGNDAMALLESPHVDRYLGIDVVPQAIEGFRRRVASAPPATAPGLVCGDFAEHLADPAVREAGYNCVYAYSSLHYFASAELKRIFALVRSLLLAGGRNGFFAFGLKGTGSIWEGQGLPLYRPDVWINPDGQSRWFPTRQALAKELDAAGFEVRFHELHNHWGYSEKGKRDTFHYVVCTPRASFLGEGI
ncbi:methyltransferase domain-containing protein [Vulgatibacter sp.]|uniref:methyltransferase domain-containing protein n=1 Tax=Vulgatibacter sp. TaxID=1971226 RepID=UPI0035647918